MKVNHFDLICSLQVQTLVRRERSTLSLIYETVLLCDSKVAELIFTKFIIIIVMLAKRDSNRGRFA
jgi:hypothetical protein